MVVMVFSTAGLMMSSVSPELAGTAYDGVTVGHVHRRKGGMGNRAHSAATFCWAWAVGNTRASSIRTVALSLPLRPSS